MLSIFVETSCNRYNRDECISCHVYEPLMEHPVSEWHLTLEQARHMAEKIKNVAYVIIAATMIKKNLLSNFISHTYIFYHCSHSEKNLSKSIS